MTTYQNIKSYTLKARLYPNKTAQKVMTDIITGLEKAANMTLWALKNHEPTIIKEKEYVDKETGETKTVFYPDFYKMGSAEWVNKLREQNELINVIPAPALCSQVGGLFGCDMKKTWEMQGKCHVDYWFNKRNKKGHKVLSFYKNEKSKDGFYARIGTTAFKQEDGKIYVNIPKVGKTRIRGWNDKIKFGENADKTFFEYYGNNKTILGCHITRDRCDNWYISITLSDVKRPFVDKPKESIGIDVNLSEETGVTLSNGMTYPNKRFKKNEEQKLVELNRRISRRFGYGNIKFRETCSEIKKQNEETGENIVVTPSKGYLRAKRAKARLESKVQRRRTNWQHQISADIIAQADFIGIESLNVSGMLKNSNLSGALSDAAFYSQLDKIKYKADWRGIPVQQIGAFDPSSHICPKCRYKMEGDEYFGLNVRQWTCPKCGATHNRDIAAAQNILHIAQEYYQDGIHAPDGTVPTEKPKTKTKRIPKDKVLDKKHADIIIHFDESMAAEYKNPWVILRDGCVIDNANGYGYATAQNAQKAFKHKLAQAG